MPPIANTHLEQRRQTVITALTEHFANDRLPMDAYERLVATAQGAPDFKSLALVEDEMPSLPAAADPTAPRPPAAPGEIQNVTAIMADRRMQGNWLRADAVASFALMASQVFDFRDVAVRGPIHLEVFAIMGEVRVIVPEDLAVRLEVLPIMGEAILGRGVAAVDRPGQPYLLITGNAIMGSVKVTVK